MSKTSLANRLRWASVVSSVGAALIGFTVLIGWATGSDPLKGSIFAGITMKANTAVCIALLGVAVALGTLGRLATARQRVAVLSCAAVVGVIAIATLSQHVFGWDLGIDQLLFHEHSGAAATQSPNRMGPVASFSLSLLALGMLVSRRPVQAGLPLFQILALCVLVIASIPVLGYLFNARQLFGIARLTGISMPTAVALQLLALGLMLSRPTVGLAGRLIAGDSGALLVRRLLPAALLIPPLLMLLRLQGERLGFYDLEFGRALLVLAFIIVFTMMVWRTGGIVSRQEADAARAERAHRDRLAHFLESMTDGFVACDPSWRVTYVNAAAERISGKSREQFVGRSCWEVLPKASPAVESEWRRAMVERVPVKLEVFDHDRGAHYEYDVFPTPDGLACYVRDVTEQVEADRRKNEFLATLAHELRNPLAPVINAMFLLRNRGGGGPESVRACEIVNRQVAHLTRLIDDLMDVARISQDKLELRKARVRLAELVAGAVEASRYLIDKQGQTLSIEFPQEPIELDADAVRLVQVLGNLLTNASRYTPERGSIALTARRDDDQLTITVADTGIGITAEQMPHIFEMFFQAERDNRRGRHGLGIGLALVKKLVELHGGEVSARSAGSGKGSEFVVRIPLPLAVGADEAPPRSASASRRLTGLRVLVVEDNQDSAEMLGTMLKSLGADVELAYDGEAGLTRAETFAPQVVLLDIGLPGMSGYDVARELRRVEWGAGTLIVALTGWGQAEDRARSHAAGFDWHLVKPVSPEKLLELLCVPLRQSAAGA